MPSLVRQRRGRVAGEWVLRAVALALLALALWRLIAPPVQRAGLARVAGGAGLSRALAQWSLDSTARDVAVQLDALPGAVERDWLRALAQAGRRVRWSATGAVPTAVSVEPVIAPGGLTRIRIASVGPATSVADAAGPLDSVPTRDGPAELSVVGVDASLRVSAPGVTARAAVPAAAPLRRVLVVGAAGWEAKFVVAALEEAGWTVDARIALAPTVQVTQGPALPPDTARLAAVVVLDSSAASSLGALGAYVRSGGGLVLAGEAAAAPAFGALTAGASGPATPGIAGALGTAEPRRALRLRPIARLRADAVSVESRGALVAVAARRFGAGRVLQLGYEESWRWRMEGDDAAPAAHRAWWSAVVSSVAFAPASPPPVPTLDAAPWAHTVDALGAPEPASRAAMAASAPERAPLPIWMLTLSLAALVAEWASRRLRGAR